MLDIRITDAKPLSNGNFTVRNKSKEMLKRRERN